MGRAVVRSREKQMSCFIAFDSSLPVLDVQIMRGGAGWREAGGGQRKKGIEGETAAANSNLQVKRGGGGGGGEMGQAFIQSLRSWPSLFQAFRTDSGMGYGLAIN